MEQGGGPFDRMAKGLICTDDEGNVVFFPWGMLGKCYIVPTMQERMEIQRLVKKYYTATVLLGFAALILEGIWHFGFSVLLMWISFCTIVTAWYIVTARELVKNLRVAPTRPTYLDRLRQRAQSYSWGYLEFGFGISLLFVLIGLVVATRGEILMGVSCLLLGAPGVLAFAYMHKTKSR